MSFHSYAPRIAEIALLLIGGWLMYGMWQPETAPQTSTTPSAQVPADPSVDIKALSASALFGKPVPAAKAEKPVIAKPIEEVHLEVKLLGTIVTSEKSAAIMTAGTSAETMFFLGDSLYGWVILKAVEKDAVLLDNRGKVERIMLSERVK